MIMKRLLSVCSAMLLAAWLLPVSGADERPQPNARLSPATFKHFQEVIRTDGMSHSSRTRRGQEDLHQLCETPMMHRQHHLNNIMGPPGRHGTMNYGWQQDRWLALDQRVQSACHPTWREDPPVPST